MLKYSYPQEVLQEIPGELSLALSISGCKLNCKGCHSAETWDKNFGEDLNVEHLLTLLKKYKHSTCVLFYGGEWDQPELLKMLKYLKIKGLKTALYTGEEIDYFNDEFIEYLDFIKVGPYIKELGGMGSLNTNQRLYKTNGHKKYFSEIKL